MQVLTRAEVEAAFDADEAELAIAEGFRLFSRGNVQLASVGHLAFLKPEGETHIKSGYVQGQPYFVVKVATNFPGNARQGGAINNGFITLVSATNGAPVVLLRDEGWLTDMRTAIAGAIAAKLIAPPNPRNVGIVGAGVQAALQARFVSRRLGAQTIRVWARNQDEASSMARQLQADGLSARSAALAEVCSQSDVIVTATSSRQAIIAHDMLPQGARLVAVGADAPGKQELDPAILAGARMVIADSRTQCIDHGECGWAVRAGTLASDRIVEIGALLGDDAPRFAPTDVVVADLTGLAVQDLQIAHAIWSRAEPLERREGWSKTAGPI